MGSTEPDRSLSSGVSIPQWMKQKVGDRYDFDDSAFSPPAHDDNFFYIRYPKQVKKVKEKSKYSSINEFLEAKERISKEEEAGLSDQHTSACRRYMPEGGLKLGFDADQDPTMSALRRKGPQILEGVAEEQSCGQSVVQVAQQMTGHITGAVMQSGIRAYVEVPSRLRERRGSKSLPTSPISSPQTSPKIGRRAAGPVAHNRYFTPAMTLTPASGGRTSILSRLLGGEVAGRSRLTSEDEEESAEDPTPVGTRTAELRRNKSTSALLSKGVEGFAQAEGESLVQKVAVLKPKPSELREMNFWSPTSM
ncbi:hypothetical protein J437_LFUL017115 [Ladona fulva]|uniref:Uncharacterized protein n=1 Tax=Ladona fulva TaxID=123851 RepID=A0A8K0KKL7_LADFU|nr:hypothetical protein J437_LFUL017115 [Ladona fulva]